MGSMILYSLIFGFMIVMIIFITLDKHTYSTVMGDTVTDLNTTNTTFSQNIKATVQVMQSSWKYIPLFALFSMLYFAFSRATGGE